MPALIPPYADVGAWLALSVACSARGQALDLVEHSRHHLRRVSQRGGPRAEFSNALMRATTSRADHSPFALNLACPCTYPIQHGEHRYHIRTPLVISAPRLHYPLALL